MIENDTDHGRAVLDAVQRSVGLLVNAAAIVDAPGGHRRISGEWLVNDAAGGMRVSPPRASTVVNCSEVETRRHTGVLLRGPRGQDYVATGAHCISVSSREIEQLRLVVGLRSVDQVFAADAEFELREIVHYEDMPDRDIAMISVQGRSRAGSMTMPPADPSFEGADEKRVYVVGHAGGRGLQVYSGTFESRVPPNMQRRARAINIDIPGSRRCLSGAPVFRWADGRAMLLGVIRASEPIERYLKVRAQELAGGDPSKLGQLLRGIHDAMTHAEALLGASKSGLAEAFGRACSTCPEVASAFDAHTHTSRLRAIYFAERLRTRLKDDLDDDEIERLAARLVADDCDPSLDDGKHSVTLVHGAPSLDLVHQG